MKAGLRQTQAPGELAAWLGGAMVLQVFTSLDSSLGLGQIRISVAQQMEREYPDEGPLPQSSSARDTVEALETDRYNIGYVAAYVRDLTDLRTGQDGPHVGDLTTTDMQIIYGAYRGGVKNYKPDGTWEDAVAAYRTATKPGYFGQMLKL